MANEDVIYVEGDPDDVLLYWRALPDDAPVVTVRRDPEWFNDAPFLAPKDKT